MIGYKQQVSPNPQRLIEDPVGDDYIVLTQRPNYEAGAIPAIKNYFKAYVSSGELRHIIDGKQFNDLATNPALSTRDFRAVPEKYRSVVPEYIKDYVSLNQFAP